MSEASEKSRSAFTALMNADDEGFDLTTRWNAAVDQVTVSELEYDDPRSAERAAARARLLTHPRVPDLRPLRDAVMDAEEVETKRAALRLALPLLEQIVAECVRPNITCAACGGRGYTIGEPKWGGA